MTTKIGWTFISDVGSSIFFEPVSEASCRAGRNRAGGGVANCPAVQIYESRVFHIRCPFTISIRAHKDSKGWSFRPVFPDTEVEEGLLSSFLEIQPLKLWRRTDTPIVQLSLPYVFVADEEVFVNQIESPFYEGAKNWSLVQGRFNIREWQRPLNWAAEWTQWQTDLVLKRGQPLFSVLFETLSPDRGIALNQVNRTLAMEKAISSAVGVAKMVKGTLTVIKAAGKRRPEKLLE